jgi:uncharacterized protein
MELEWDEAKRQQTLKERGLDFADANKFDAAGLETKQDLRADYGEVRFNVVGYPFGVLCTYCWTPRGEKMRIISMRKINERERKGYQKKTGGTPDAG